MRKHFEFAPSGKQLATRAEALAPPGKPLNKTGVSSGSACGACNPAPCGLTTIATHSATKAWRRSRLVIVNGISTRNRVLRRDALGVSISMRAESCVAALRLHA